MSALVPADFDTRAGCLDEVAGASIAAEGRERAKGRSGKDHGCADRIVEAGSDEAGSHGEELEQTFEVGRRHADLIAEHDEEACTRQRIRPAHRATKGRGETVTPTFVREDGSPDADERRGYLGLVCAQDHAEPTAGARRDLFGDMADERFSLVRNQLLRFSEPL